MAMSNTISDPKKQLTTLLEGILLGRTLYDLEKQAGASVEQLLKLLQHDEATFLDFKTAREFSAYVIEDNITQQLRGNMENPKGAVQNNAVKIWADHMHWMAERRNPAAFSGKAAIHMTVPVQFITDLDLNAPKTIDNIYEFEATIVEEQPVAAIAGDVTEATFEPVPPRDPDSPFSGAVLASGAQETEPTALEYLAREQGGPDSVAGGAGQDPFAGGAARFVEDAGEIRQNRSEPAPEMELLPPPPRKTRGRPRKIQPKAPRATENSP